MRIVTEKALPHVLASYIACTWGIFMLSDRDRLDIGNYYLIGIGECEYLVWS